MNGNLFDGLRPESAPPSSTWLTAHCDGGSRGNPGPAGYGAVIEDGSGRVVARLSEFLGVQTNNYAEYAGLLAVLKWASKTGARRLRVVSDSELMVKQMNGQYKVASPALRPLWEEARRLARNLDAFEMAHTLRGGNKEADRLANEAMDRGMGKGREQANQGPRNPGNREPAGAGGPGGVSRSHHPSGANHSSQKKSDPVVLEGYVKDGVVHLLEGELPDGIFVKVVRE
jgi:ribonuclease HI